MNYDESLRYLLELGHETLAIKFGLENSEHLLADLGNPHRSFPAVQVAGTNGKGSTCAMLESICGAASMRTGLYTSPHLRSVTERIRIAGREIEPDYFARLATRVSESARRLCDLGILGALPTFFEHLTAIAILAFRESLVDLAILETGLGGRLDATTSARAGMAVITPVALDHQEYLGETLAEIAAEKAAIIRNGVVAVIAPQPPEALDVILTRCASCSVTPRVDACKAKVVDAEPDGRFRVTFETKKGIYPNVRLGLRGRHQVINASVAVAAAEALIDSGVFLQGEAIIRGLESATHPGRLELWQRNPRIIFDGAHNPAGARALRDYLDEFVDTPLTLIFGAMRDKDLAGIAEVIFPIARYVILTQSNNPRAASPETLARFVSSNQATGQVVHASDPSEAISEALRLTPPDGVICVTGSLYLIGDVQSLLADEKP
jgi:dihydrofolate synthase/folylpolyglutamate synthase